MQIVDITNPRESRIVAVYDCGVTQGDVQVFRQADKPGRTFVAYASDTYGDGTSTCYQEAAALGFDVKKSTAAGKNGTFIAEITDPLHPVDGLVRRDHPGRAQPERPPERELPLQLELGPDHVLPAGDRDLRHPQLRGAGEDRGARAADAARPRHRVARHQLLDDGSRAYSAALSQGVVIDTTNAGDPSVIASWLDPAINVWHQVEPYTTTDASGRARLPDRRGRVRRRGRRAGLPERRLPRVRDHGRARERAREGGLLEHRRRRLLRRRDGTCTAHVFRIHEREQLHDGGVLQRRRARGRPLRACPASRSAAASSSARA